MEETDMPLLYVLVIAASVAGFIRGTWDRQIAHPGHVLESVGVVTVLAIVGILLATIAPLLIMSLARGPLVGAAIGLVITLVRSAPRAIPALIVVVVFDIVAEQAGRAAASLALVTYL